MIKKDFSLKIDEYRHKSNQEKLTFLSSYWEFNIQNEPFKLIGTYEKADKSDKNGKEYGFFNNVRNLDGDILYYPFNLGQVRIWVEHKESLLKQDFWSFDVKLNENLEIKNPFQLNLANKVFGNPKNVLLDRIEKEKLIRKIFIETGSTQRDAKNLSNALKRIAGDLYTETERFIFELIQNADDIPNENGEVDVKFNLLLENLLFLHNGKPFDNSDVESISSIGDSTKRKDAEKTGYKGIGFKSVFTDAETVLIRSGNFSFSFDKHSPLYENQNIDEIPWEIKPIWTEKYRYPKEVKNNKDFFEYPVAIDLVVGNDKIFSYRKQISQLFSEPRFILFLRNIKGIEVQGLDSNIKIQKKKKDERFELLSNENPIEEWCKEDFDFSVSQETRDAMASDKVVPEKLKEIQKSKLSFACQVNNNEILSIPSDKSFLFTYLPTNVNDYSFPFLVNADFLTTANRQDIHKKNSWNLFLFERIGYLCFKWISKFAQMRELRNSITNLIPNYYDNNDEPVYLHFNKGYDQAIDEIAFLPTYSPLLTKVSDAIVDITGFSDVIGKNLFYETQFAQKNLIINELQNKEILSKFAGITIFDKQKLKILIGNNHFGELTDIKELLRILQLNKELSIDSCDIRDIVEIVNIESLNNWIETCDEETTYTIFLKELEESSLRKETKIRICQIKFFKFSNGESYSLNDVITKDDYWSPIFKLSNCIFTNNKTKGIKNELIKLGLVVSELNVEDYPKIFSSIVLPSDKKQYELIAKWCAVNGDELSAEEKKKLFLNLINETTKFDNVAEGTLKDLCLFCDSNSEIKPLGKLIGNIKTPSWLNKFKIKQDEYFSELNSYLICELEGIFKEIYHPNQDDLLSELTTLEEIKSLIELYQANQKSFFKEFIIRKEHYGFLIEQKTNETFQVQSSDKEARKFIDENCDNNLFVLPYEFVDKFKDEDGIIKADDLYILILDFVDVDEYKETLVDIVKYKAKHKFLQELSEFRFNSETEYTKEDYEYKIIDLACSELKESDYQKFKNKVVIETDEEDLKLSEIPPLADKIKIANKELSLTKILPDTYQNSDYLNNVINQFVRIGINKDRIENIFGIKQEIDPSKIFSLFSEQTDVLGNAEQLAFLILYGNVFEESIEKFKVETLDEREYELKYDYYTNPFSFIGEDYLLKNQYSDVSKIIDLPITIGKSRHIILKQPYIVENRFVCPSIKSTLTDEEKIDFFNFIFFEWKKDRTKFTKEIDWSKIGETETEEILGFKLTSSVYPSNYASENEILPDYLITWIGEEESKIGFLSDLGVWVKDSLIIELRRYLKGDISEFRNNLIAQEKRFNYDESALFETFEWLKQTGIELINVEQFVTFKKVVEIINENRKGGNLIIEEDIDFELLEEHSTEWKTTENYRILLFNGQIPKVVRLDEIKDYVFYRYSNSDYIVNNEIIYINSNTDENKTLQLVVYDEDNDFSSGELLPLFGERSKREIELEKENAMLRQQVANANVATLGTEFSTDLSINDQKEANREAKEIVKEKLEREGFEFKLGIGNYSTINGVYKDNIEFPLVVKSYKCKDEPLKIGANEWIQLMRPNSMFWVHFGDRKLDFLKLYELLRNQDKLTISFSTENLDVEDRLEKFAELLHYFGNVHFDFSSLEPSYSSVAKNLRDYRFDERQNEEDLSGDDDSLL